MAWSPLPGSIRSHGAGFQVRVCAGIDALTGERLYLHEQAATAADAEKARTRMLARVDENRHPRSKATIGFILDRWLYAADPRKSTRQDHEDKIRVHIRPVFSGLRPG